MRSRHQPFIRAASAVPAVLVLLAGDASGQAAPTSPTPRQVRITMQALHQLGGVPPGWNMMPLSGDTARGRVAYEQFGCHTCHAVRGESFPPPTGAGPELTGMGSHHPAAYFVESIVNPNAVVVDGPGFVDTDGRSTMPSYPDMTVAQLTDVVAYLRSLQGGEIGSAPAAPPAAAGAADADLPPPPVSAARRYLVQVYDVAPGRLPAFEDWFQRQGRAQFLSEPGLLAIDTLVDRTRSGPRLVTILTFEDDAAVTRFATSVSADRVSQQFDAFIGPHGHEIHVVPPIYRSDALSAHR